MQDAKYAKPNWSEEMLESWLWDNPGKIGVAERLMGRQVRLPNDWRIDLVGYDGDLNRIVITELKCGPITPDAAMQVIAYRAIWDRMILDQRIEAVEEYTRPRPNAGTCEDVIRHAEGSYCALIGTSIDERTEVALASIDDPFMMYTCVAGQMTFETTRHDNALSKLVEEYM